MIENNQTQIKCPYCNRLISLDEALTHSLEEKIRIQLEKNHLNEMLKVKDEMNKKNMEINNLKKATKKQIENALNSQKKQIEKQAEERAEEKSRKEKLDLQAQVEEKNKMLKKSMEEELNWRKEKIVIEEKNRRIEIENLKKLDAEREKIRAETKKEAEELNELKNSENKKKMEDLQKLIIELKRKGEQGSQKIQGEVLELNLEKKLKEKFVYDKIEPIPSKIKGADILQNVYSKTGLYWGNILIESKNTKKWSNAWVSKLKNDKMNKKADIAIIVTIALPEGVDRYNFTIKEGIIIVHYHNVIPIITLLRTQLYEMTRIKTFNVNKDEKLELLYKYLTGEEFKQKVSVVVEAFHNMKNDLNKEKRAMETLWKKRDKQIELALFGMAGMYGGLQGILGSSLQEIESLELQTKLIGNKKED